MKLLFVDNQATASPLPLARLQLEESLNGLGSSGVDKPSAICGSPMSQRSSFLHSNIRRESSHVLADISEVETATDAAVQNIAAMFPTVDESHIKDLLKK